jgi:hypothetical protein
MANLVCIAEPITWVLRLCTPDGTDYPPFHAVTTAIKTSAKEVMLKGAYGTFKRGGQRAVLLTLADLGFEYVRMERHGREVRYQLDYLLRGGKFRGED